jgi:ABC-2 type transport system permease protein
MINALTKNELIKTFAQKKLRNMLILQFLFGIAPLIIGFGSDGQSYPLFLHGLTVSWIIPIFITVLVTDMFTEEYTNGTLTLPLVHPVTRGELLAAKVLSLLILIFIILTATMVIGYVAGTVMRGWGSQFLYRGVARSSAKGIYLTILTYLCSVIPLFVFGLLVMLLAFLINNSGAVVGVSLGLILLFAFLGFLDSNINPYLVTYYFSSFPQSLLFAKNFPEAMLALKVMAVYGICSYASSIAIFLKRDLVN